MIIEFELSSAHRNSFTLHDDTKQQHDSD